MSVQEIEPRVDGAGGPVSVLPPVGRAGWRQPLAWLTIIGSAAFLLGPLLAEYGRQLLGLEHYQFFPMLLAAVGWLAWRRFQSLPAGMPPESLLLRVGLWSAGALLTAAAVLATSPFGAVLALLTLILAGLYEWGGGITLRRFLPVWGVLLLAVRLPFGWDQKMIVSLQSSAATWASGVLDLMGIRHLADGVVIRLPERDFFVEEACSGVHSLFAALSFLAVYSVVTHRGLIRFLILAGVALFWVLVANSLRIIAVVILSTRYDLPVVDGVGHEILGIAVFATVIGLLLSTDRLLLFLVPQRERFPGEDAPVLPIDDRVPRAASWGPAWVALVFVGLMGGYALLPARADWTPTTPYASSEGFVPLPEETLPKSWNGWDLVEFQVREREKGDIEGEISRIWYYRKGRLAAAISIDGPFQEWHDTEVCYRGLGYVTQACDDHAVKRGDHAEGAFTELEISGPGGEQGYVLFMAYTEDGKPMHPPASRHASVARLLVIWRDRVTGRVETPPGGRVYQVQLFTKSGLTVSDAERNELKRLFHNMRTEIAKTTASERGGVSQDAPAAGEDAE